MLRIAKGLLNRRKPEAEELKVRRLLDRWGLPETVIDDWTNSNQTLLLEALA